MMINRYPIEVYNFMQSLGLLDLLEYWLAADDQEHEKMLADAGQDDARQDLPYPLYPMY